jgi:hypothetical protein
MNRRIIITILISLILRTVQGMEKNTGLDLRNQKAALFCAVKSNKIENAQGILNLMRGSFDIYEPEFIDDGKPISLLATARKYCPQVESLLRERDFSAVD